MEIFGEKIVLRPYTLERCHEFYQGYMADPAMTDDNYTYDQKNVNRYYETKVLDTTRCFFAICHNNNIIGEIQIKRIDLERRCGTLSIILKNDTVKGKGFGTEAERLMLDYASNALGLHTLYADVVHRNCRSKRVLEKVGFKHLYNDDDLAYYEYRVK